MDTFAARLKYARLLRHLSQSDLARRCGLSQSAISSYESGARKAPAKVLCLAQTLEVSIYWLSQGQGPMTLAPATGLSLSETTWPFPSISARQFWSLRAADRLMLEKALSTLIDGLLTNSSPDRPDGKGA